MTVCSITFLNFKINQLDQRRNFPGNLTVIYLKFDSSAPSGTTPLPALKPAFAKGAIFELLYLLEFEIKFNFLLFIMANLFMS